MSWLSLNTAAASPPVSLSEAKAHLRVDGSDEDTLISSLILAATRVVEEQVGRALVSQIWDLKTGWPDAIVDIPLAPVISLDAMSYQDADDEAQTLDVADFYLFASDDTAKVQPKGNAPWPSMAVRPDALTITFTAGYSEVPEPLKQAVLLLIAQWFEHRVPVGRRMENLPLAFEHIVFLYRLGWVR